ncbi:predicted protein [Uncinocarpus reesii 1704]|uniref:Uncharacterized protein n=1 Tax=Uncinocarpus reesii (strain UAMH 1704) TaxID=336963 RepID=C4JUL4_UNCRE|nr:uncharacterized protein UREG_04817 [Uncinocarpus reesii 1704]EEP79975.1 predicted protein [Uncinocarpus reesii 1704]
MVKSFRAIIESVLEEIALCGDRGASPAEVLGFIDAIYALPDAQDVRQTEPQRLPKVDHRLKCKLWEWLTKHPEVSVGKNSEGNSLSLDEALVRDPQPAAPASEIDPALVAAEESGLNEAVGDALRVFVSEERAWRAITGHKPDTSRVFPSELALLSIIASHKARGIVQSDLVKLSGQDKRSVPKRTDSLQRKGYIEKKAIQYKGARTSLCILRKYAVSAPAEIFQTVRPESERVGNPREDLMIDFSALLDKLLQCLREQNVIERNDLKKKLGMTVLWRSKILRRAIRKLEAIGCVRRVHAVSQYSEVTLSAHPCVMLIREPTEKDIQLFHDDSSAVIASLQQGDVGNLDDAEEQDEDEDMEDMLTTGPLQSTEVKGGIVQDVGRIIPGWTPDQSLPNFIFNLVDGAGPRGMNNLEIAAKSLGNFFRRPVESLLSRLVDSWQYTQPLHLRHLALIRDTALRSTTFYFVQYSFRNFAALVNDGQASWEAVGTAVKKNAGRPPPIDAKAEVDKYGFVIEKCPSNLLRQGNATLQECLECARPSNYATTSLDPVVVYLRDGTFGIRLGKQIRTQATPGSTIDVGVAALAETGDKIERATKRTASDAGLLQELEATAESPLAAARTAKRKKKMEDLEAMSELDRLTAQGYDKSWTVYSALTLERPCPGLYLTPIGKRRAVGMRQGRPRKSRIAIFKFPRLKEFDWFINETPAGHSEARDGMAVPVAENRSISEAGEFPAPVTRRALRKSSIAAEPLNQEVSESEVSDTVSPADTSQAEEVVVTTTRVSKKRKRAEDEGTITEEPNKIVGALGGRRRGKPPQREDSGIPPEVPVGHDAPTTSVIEGPLRMPKVGAGPQSQQNQIHDVRMDQEQSVNMSSITRIHSESMPENALLGSHSHQPNKDAIAMEPELTPVRTIDMIPSDGTNAPNQREGIEPCESIDEDGISRVERSPPADTAGQGRGASVSQTPVDLKSVSVTPSTSPTKFKSKAKRASTKRDIRGGSIAFQRRKIVMDIIEQCGGAHPMGTELWYPFTTAWLKTRTEKPDMRTIRSAVSALIDAGTLRQHTFSGKNSKGLMVTKTIIAKPEIDPTDPIIRNLQGALLKTDPQLYLHPNVTVDPTLKKSHKGLSGHDLKLPEVEDEVRVTLNYIPARFRPRPPKPRRRFRFVQDRRLLRAARRDFGAGEWQKRVRLLKGLHHRPSASPFLDSLSIPAPHSSETAHLPVLRPWPPNMYLDLLFGEKWKPTLLVMLMSPPQTFNAATGTFGTGVCYMTKKKRAYKPKPELPKITSLPDSLDNILSMSGKRVMDIYNILDPISMIFFSHVDIVREWELRHEFPDAPLGEELKYVNHTIPGPFESAPLEGPIVFVDRPRARPLKPAERRLTRQATARGVRAYTYRRLFLNALPRQDRADQTFVLVPQRAGAAGGRRLEQFQEPIKPLQEAAKPMERVSKRGRPSKEFPEIDLRKLMMAIVVLRVLAGGLEARLTDWSLVASIFPGYDAKSIHDCGKSILSRHRLQIIKMQRDFQERFIEAYELDLLPRIDYNNLEGYDWGAVVDWAEQELEKPSLRKVPSLPATHEQFSSIFDVRKEPAVGIDELYQYNVQPTLPRKRTLYATIPFAVPVVHKRPQTVMPLNETKRAEAIRRLDLAKTWVRANIVTAEESYKPTEARQILERFGEELIGDAIQSLITERVISMGNRGRITPGRNFDVTENFLNAFGRKRATESTQVMRAIHFKLNVLDPAIQAEGKYQVAYEAEDGDIIVLLNMLSEGRVTLWPMNPPQNKFGLTERGYLTRLMDKSKLFFDMEIRPVPGQYVHGNPLTDKIQATPVPHTDLSKDGFGAGSVLPKLPLWIDVHGGFVRLLWELAVAAILGLLAARPGAGVEVIKRTMQPYLGGWEIELILQWLVTVDAIETVGGNEGDGVNSPAGWIVKEWWYLALG